MVEKTRLDQALVLRGLAESRTKAQSLIMAGLVIVGDKRIDKAGTLVADTLPILVKGQDHPWVSRGGLKLIAALEKFNLNPLDIVAVDIGASTGGFTHVLLHHGAAKIYAVDVGHGQLAWSLRQDPRVIVLERTNARHLTTDEIPQPPDWIVCDASFIGLQTILPAALDLAAANAILIALIKPQFEVGKGRVGKGGVVRDPALHTEVCNTIQTWLNSLPEWSVIGLCESPITGPEGNHEFLIVAQKSSMMTKTTEK